MIDISINEALGTYIPFLPYALLVIGFIALIKGADFFVDGSASIAKKFRIPDIIIGLTVVAMGTSMPELAVSLSSALGGSTDMAVGNVVGSNIINVLVILGLSAVIRPINVDTSVFRRDIPVLLLSAVLLPIMAWAEGGKISWISGIILTALFITYIVLNVRDALKYRREQALEIPTVLSDNGAADESEIKQLPLWKSILFAIGGAALIVVGATLSVDGATVIAQSIGLSEKVIALTVVALGTSLPELVTSVVAARKGNSDIALGNIVGSNIFNVLLILGTTSLVCPAPTDFNGMIDLAVMLGISVLLAVTAFTGKKLSRIEGASYLVIYGGYLTYLFLR